MRLMEESLHDYVVRRLNESKGQWPDIARKTDMSRSMIVKIARRDVADPGVSFVERLARHFREQDRAAA